MTAPSCPAEWFHRAFDHAYNLLYAHRDDDEARRCIDLAASRIPQFASPERAGPVLDLCCGAGRHSAEVHSRGLDVVSLDLSTDLLQTAWERDAGLLLVRADMRSLPFASATFGVVLNFFTSFGYFDAEEEHLATAREMARVLRPGGYLLWDHLNPAALRARLDPLSSRETSDGAIATERRWLDDTRHRVEKVITLHRPCTEPLEYVESVRFFEPDEAQALFAAAGFEMLERMGNYDGSPFGADSPRQILLLRRNEARESAS